MVAKVNVKQHFKNTSVQWVEGSYVFPLPENAAVNRMQIKIGERIIKSTIKRKKRSADHLSTSPSSRQAGQPC